MDINTQNSSGMMNGMPPVPSTEKKVGPIVGALIIVLMLIIAALYFFGSKLNTQSPVNAVPEEQVNNASNVDSTNINSDADMTATAGQADDVTSLQADLDAQMKNVDYSF